MGIYLIIFKNWTKRMSTEKILQALKILSANNTRENAEKLAEVAGLRLAQDKSFQQPPTETFSIYDPNVPKVIPDTSTPLRAAVIQLEDEIRLDNMENGIIFDENGKVLLSKRGKPDHLTLTEKELLLLKGCVFTHNHPNGTPFSERDVLMAIDYGISELRVVTSLFRYFLRPQKGREWPSRLALDGYLEKSIVQANMIVNDMVKMGDLHYSHAKNEHRHYTWVLVALYLDLVYGREKS